MHVPWLVSGGAQRTTCGSQLSLSTTQAPGPELIRGSFVSGYLKPSTEPRMTLNFFQNFLPPRTRAETANMHHYPWFYALLGFEPKASLCMPGKYSTIELYLLFNWWKFIICISHNNKIENKAFTLIKTMRCDIRILVMKLPCFYVHHSGSRTGRSLRNSDQSCLQS